MTEEMNPAGLLRSAARLIERALIKLDMTETACDTCQTRHFANRDHAKVYERFTNTPLALTEAANRLDNLDEDAPAQAARKR